jgi:CheY-like chemotaxis protein
MNDSGKVSILVADDDECVRDFLRRGLTPQGFEVWLATDGQEALELYRQARAELAAVLLDVNMPRLNGPDTLLCLRLLDPTIPVCFMSGGLGEEEEEALLQEGAHLVLRKPFRLDEIVSCLQQMIACACARRRVTCPDSCV